MSKVLISDVAVINKKNIELNKNLKFINYLDTSSITNNKVDGYQTLYINKDKIPSRAKRLVKNNTIVYSSVRPRLCHFGILKDLPENPVVSTGFITIDAKEDIIDPYYLYYILTSKANVEYLSSIADTSVSSYPSINSSDISNMEINIIKDINEQRKIANILKAIDFKIENNNKINEELESMAKTIYDYWFLQFEFPNEEGKPYKSCGGKMEWNNELKREIPKDWEFGALKNILSELECGNRPKGGCNDSIKDGVPSIGAENIISIGKYDFSTEKYISKDYYLSLKKGIVKSNDVLLYKDGAGVGKSSMAKNNFPYEECAVNSHVFILRTKENNLYQNYLYLTLQKEYIKKILIDLSMKAAQPGLNQTSVESVPILIPSTDIIVKFNNIIDILFNKIFLNSNENKELTSLRDFLLPLLMNGQVGFRELALAED